jgi:ankyrin repeat protein
MEFGADVNLSDRAGKKLGRTPLMYAAEGDNADLVQLLLEAGAIVDAQDKRGQTALFYAVEEEAIEAIEVLLEFGADPYKQSWDGTPFEHATYGDPEIAKLLMAVTQEENNVASNAAREEMLRSAAFDDNAELVHNLIQQGVNVSAADDHGTGWTALMFAAAKGNATIVQLLIAAGADVSYKSASGQSALGEAKNWKNKEIIDLLKSASPSSN